jgi:hypothetical protein
MSIVEIIILANMISFYFISQAGLPDKLGLDFKPFNCSLCLSAWIGLILYFLPSWIDYSLLCMFGAGFISPFFRQFFANLYFKIK